MDNIFTEVFDDKEVLEKLTNIENKINSLGNTSEQMGGKLKEAISGAGSVAQNVVGSVDKLADSVSKQATAVAQAERQNRSWTSALGESISSIKLGDKSLGEYVQTAKAWIEGVKGGETALNGATVASRLFGVALKAIGIGLITELISALISYLSKLQTEVDKVNRILAGASAVVAELTNRFLGIQSAVVSAAKALGSFITGDFAGYSKNASDAAQGFSKAVSGLTDSLQKAYTAGAELERRTQVLRDATLAASVEIDQQRHKVEELKAAYEDESKSFSSRINARKQESAVESAISDGEIARAREALDIAKGNLELHKDDESFKKAAIDAEIALNDLIAAKNGQILSAESDIRELRKQAHDAYMKMLEEENKAIAKVSSDLEKLRFDSLPDGLDKDIAAVTKKYDDLIKIAQEGEATLLKIQQRRALSPDELEKLEQLGGVQVALEQRKYEAIQKAYGDFVNKEIADAERLANSQKKDADDKLKDQIKAFELENELRNQDIDLTQSYFEQYIGVLKANGGKEKDIKALQFQFDADVKKARIESEIKFQEQLLSLTDESDAATIQKIENTIRNLKVKLQGLTIGPPKDKDKGKPQTIFDILGLGLDTEQQSAVDKAVKELTDSLSKIADLRVKEAEAAVKAADDKVKAAQTAYDKELELGKKGLSNNSELRKQELDAAKKDRDAALKEETKARKAQITLDTATQVSGLITSSVNIFTSLSKLGPIGVVAAVITIGAMLAAFAEAKAKAYKAAEAPKLRTGKRFDGPTHEQGGEDLVSDGKRVYAVEKDEWLLGTQPSREHNEFLRRMNAGEFKGVDLLAAVAGHRGDRAANPLQEAAPRIERMREQRADLEHGNHYRTLADAYERTAEKITAEIRKKPVGVPWKKGYKLITDTGHGTETRTVEPAE